MVPHKMSLHVLQIYLNWLSGMKVNHSKGLQGWRKRYYWPMESQGHVESSPSQRGQENRSGCLLFGRLGTLTSKCSAEVTADALDP